MNGEDGEICKNFNIFKNPTIIKRFPNQKDRPDWTVWANYFDRSILLNPLDRIFCREPQNLTKSGPKLPSNESLQKIKKLCSMKTMRGQLMQEMATWLTIDFVINAMQWVNMTLMNPFGIMVPLPKGIFKIIFKRCTEKW